MTLLFTTFFSQKGYFWAPLKMPTVSSSHCKHTAVKMVWCLVACDANPFCKCVNVCHSLYRCFTSRDFYLPSVHWQWLFPTIFKIICWNCIFDFKFTRSVPSMVSPGSYVLSCFAKLICKVDILRDQRKETLKNFYIQINLV